jgi:chromosome segregation ATPase
MNKNLVIGVLAAMLVLGSLWGQVGNKSRKALKLEKKAVVAQLSQVQAEAAKGHDALLAKTAKLQKTLQVKDKQLAKARHELVGLRKHNKAFEAQISKRDTALTALIQEKNKLVEQIKKMKKSLAKGASSGQQEIDALKQKLAAATSVEQVAQDSEELLQAKLAKAEAAYMDLQEKLAIAETAMNESKVLREYESVRAQVIGLEKIIEEKNATIEETSKELDHWKVNMDVLISRITEQQDGLQELQNENRELVKELAAKNQELADLNEQLIQTPVQQQ